MQMEKFKPTNYMHAQVTRKSFFLKALILTSAKLHVQQPAVVHLEWRAYQCTPSISQCCSTSDTLILKALEDSEEVN